MRVRLEYFQGKMPHQGLGKEAGISPEMEPDYCVEKEYDGGVRFEYPILEWGVEGVIVHAHINQPKSGKVIVGLQPANNNQLKEIVKNQADDNHKLIARVKGQTNKVYLQDRKRTSRQAKLQSTLVPHFSLHIQKDNRRPTIIISGPCVENPLLLESKVRLSFLD